ncbi:alpha-1D adrenergic receptor-like [Schistocerca cancellata]|uniref:alpha-1D adrenergic receptor-like n=1 Tax=Schistocerca cancellata TaxID=274614 RepID=UPI002118908A|nr:alpha-1D adrenergic receptor-like [Schistocerca cancellata]
MDRPDKALRELLSATLIEQLSRGMLAVVVAFFICWAPFHAQRLLAVYAYSSESLRSSATFVTIYQVLTHISGVFYFLGTAINPLLYHIMSHKFRQAFKETLSELCGWRRRKRRPRRAYSAVSPGHKAPARSLPQQAVSNDSQATLTTSLSRISIGADELPAAAAAAAAADRRLDVNGCCHHKLELISEHYSNERTSDGNAPAAAEERSSVSSLAKKIRDGTRTIFKRDVATSTASATPANASEQRPLPEPGRRSPKLRHADSLHLSIDSAKSTISNSSLQDMDEMEFDSSELAHYMGELNEQGLAR